MKCKHEFEFVKEMSLYDGVKITEDAIPKYIYRIYICKKCLKRKKVKL